MYKKILFLTCLFLFICSGEQIVIGAKDVLAKKSGTPRLVLMPTRVVMGARDRSAMVRLINNGTAEGVYRISFVTKDMIPQGALKAREKKKGRLYSEDIVRVSPRRVVLKPGQLQNVRLMVKRKKGMAEGEYRSHLKFTLLPDKTKSTFNNESEKNKLSISMEALIGFSIPIIVHHGKDLNVKVTTNPIKIVKDKNGKKHVKFSMTRDGNISTYGDLTVTYKKPNGKEYVINKMGGIAIYTSIKKRLFDLPVKLPKGVSLGKGKILVDYSNKEEDGGRLITKGELVL